MSRALPLLADAIHRKALIAVSGGPGLGKTTFMAAVVREARGLRVCRPYHPDRETLTSAAVYDALVYDLGERPCHQKEARARQIIRLIRSEPSGVVLIVEEAHKCPPETLSALKQLYDLCLDAGRLLSIVLVGQTPLARWIVSLGRADAEDLLRWRRRPEQRKHLGLRDLALRVQLVPITGLRAHEVPRLVAHQIARAGADPEKVLAPDVLRSLASRLAPIPPDDDVYAACGLPPPLRDTARYGYYDVFNLLAGGLLRAAREGARRVELSHISTQAPLAGATEKAA